MASRSMKMHEGSSLQQPPATEIAQPPQSDAAVAQEIEKVRSRLRAIAGPLRVRPIQSGSGEPRKETIPEAKKAIVLANALIEAKSNHPNLRDPFEALADACDDATIALDTFKKRWGCT